MAQSFGLKDLGLLLPDKDVGDALSLRHIAEK
jgi:hypothetical protein